MCTCWPHLMLSLHILGDHRTLKRKFTTACVSACRVPRFGLSRTATWGSPHVNHQNLREDCSLEDIGPVFGHVKQMPRCGLRSEFFATAQSRTGSARCSEKLKGHETYKIVVHSLPKELDEKVAELHFQVLSTEFFFPVVTWISPGVPSAGFTRHKKIHAEPLSNGSCGGPPPVRS